MDLIQYRQFVFQIEELLEGEAKSFFERQIQQLKQTDTSEPRPQGGSPPT